ncbi:hypothetical protein D3C81_1268510 [compost metagenome]
MQVVGGILGRAQRLPLRQVHQHLGRGLGAGRHQEFDLHAVDGAGLAGPGDQVGRRHQRQRALRDRLAQPGIDLAGGRTLQVGAVHVLGAAAHRVAGKDVLADGFFHEAFGRQHLDLARLDVVVADHPPGAAKVVGMAVRVDHRHHRLFGAVFVVQLQARAGGLGGGQRVDDDQAGVAFDDRHVGDVEAADLVDAVGHLEQAVVHVQPGLPPQAGIDRRRCGVLVNEAVRIQRPHHPALRIADLAAVDGADEAPARVLEIALVLERQLLQHGGLGTGRGLAGQVGRRGGGTGRSGRSGENKCSGKGRGGGGRVHAGLLSTLPPASLASRGSDKIVLNIQYNLQVCWQSAATVKSLLA